MNIVTMSLEEIDYTLALLHARRRDLMAREFYKGDYVKLSIPIEDIGMYSKVNGGGVVLSYNGLEGSIPWGRSRNSLYTVHIIRPGNKLGRYLLVHPQHLTLINK